MYLVYILRTGLYLPVDIILLVRTCCSRTVEYISIFRSEGCWTCALMRQTYPPAKDVEQAGDILDRGRRVQFVRRQMCHGKEKPAVRYQFL